MILVFTPLFAIELLKTTSETDNSEESEETENTAPHNTSSPLAITRSNLSHPTYRALAELGKVIKTIFLCKYLHSGCAV